MKLDPGYLRAIRLVESDSRNRDGADKSWVGPALEAARLHHARARRA